MNNIAAEFGSIRLSDEQAELLSVATNFCRDKSPVEKVRTLIETDDGTDLKTWRELAELGWLGIAIPESYGGVGLGLAEVVPVVEQMGRSMLSSPFVSSTLAGLAILGSGTEQQKSSILPKIVEGNVATLALMEGEGAWDYSQISSTALATNSGYKLTGEKFFVCDAMQANWIIVSALLEGKPSLFIIERALIPDTALRREIVIDETKRSYALSLEGLEIPKDAIVDLEGVEATLKHLHLAGSLLSAAEACGGAIAVIDYTVEYLKTRKQFGKVIGSYQALKHPIVDAFVQYEQARSHLYSAANCFNDQGTGEIATRMAKAQADSVFSFAADRSIQFHGGFGFTYDCDAQLYRRRAIWHAALYGDAAYHKKCLANLLF